MIRGRMVPRREARETAYLTLATVCRYRRSPEKTAPIGIATNVKYALSILLDPWPYDTSWA